MAAVAGALEDGPDLLVVADRFVRIKSLLFLWCLGSKAERGCQYERQRDGGARGQASAGHGESDPPLIRRPFWTLTFYLAYNPGAVGCALSTVGAGVSGVAFGGANG